MGKKKKRDSKFERKEEIFGDFLEELNSWGFAIRSKREGHSSAGLGDFSKEAVWRRTYVGALLSRLPHGFIILNFTFPFSLGLPGFLISVLGFNKSVVTSSKAFFMSLHFTLALLSMERPYWLWINSFVSGQEYLDFP